MGKTRLILTLVLVCAQAQAGEWWTDDAATNTLMITANTAIVGDWAQTREIADNPNYFEKSKILGENPTTGEVNRHFVNKLILTNFVGYLLPKNLSRVWYGANAALHINAMHNNYSIGVSFNWY